MEPPCGQSIVKYEKQKDDGRMETQKRKQNEKEKAERRMKIVAGFGSVDEYIPYVLAGADELFCGYVPYNWTKKYGTVLPLNRREVLAYNVQLGSFSELEILSAMIRKYRKPVHIAMNSLYYIPEQYEEIADIVKQCMKIGFDSFILADPALILYLRQKGISCKIHLSGEAGEMNREAIKVFQEMWVDRIIFHRKNTVASMRQMIEAVNAERLEFEAFALNELCQFTGAFCNSLHCDEMCHLCLVPYELGRIREGVSAESVDENVDEPEDDGYLCGQTGCGLCALYQLEKAGVTHLKLVGRGNYTDYMERDIRNLRKALEILKDVLDMEKTGNIPAGLKAEETYISQMKKELFGSAGKCSGMCYYMNVLSFCKNNRSGEHIKRRK